MALGAGRSSVLWMVLKEDGFLVGGGTIFGLLRHRPHKPAPQGISLRPVTVW